MTTRSDAAGGLLIVDKPSGWTSHDVVGRLRRLAGTRKVGHAGTLDPMATGVLVVGIDRGTKLLTFLVGCDKDYAATIRLGQATLTDDREGELTASVKATGVTDDEIAAAVHALTGDIEQVPSAVSAIKVNGERAYARVRAGEEVALAARPVTVSQFTIDAIHRAPHEAPECLDVDVRVTVSSGTYVRALARDLGAALGVGGHLTALRRTRVGGYAVGSAHTLDDLAAVAGGGRPLPLVAVGEAARAALPTRLLTEAEARTLSFGQRLPSLDPGRSTPVAALDPSGQLVAVLDESRSTTRSLVVFTPASS